MASLDMSRVDLEQGARRRSDVSAGGDTVYFSDVEEGSCYSQFYSTNGGSYDDYRFACVLDGGIGGGSDSRRSSSASDRSVEVAEERAVPETKVHLGKVEKDCRICHLGLESTSYENGSPLQLGCSCKDDLAAAHKNCAETWFKIKGNRICEICNTTARGVVVVHDIEATEEHLGEANASTSPVVVSPPVPQTETRRSFWQGQRVLNFLLACMVFAFVISWLFHFRAPSHD